MSLSNPWFYSSLLFWFSPPSYSSWVNEQLCEAEFPFGLKPLENQNIFLWRELTEDTASLLLVITERLWRLMGNGSTFQYLNGAYKKPGEKLCTRICDRTHGNVLKLKESRFSLDIGNKNHLRVLRHWNRLPKKVMGAPCLEVFKTRLDVVLSNLVEGVRELGVSLRFLPTQVILSFCVSRIQSGTLWLV